MAMTATSANPISLTISNGSPIKATGGLKTNRKGRMNPGIASLQACSDVRNIWEPPMADAAITATQTGGVIKENAA